MPPTPTLFPPSPEEPQQGEKQVEEIEESARAPTMATEPACPSGVASAICFSRCASQALSAGEHEHPTAAITNWRALLCQKRPTKDASTMPIRPMKRNRPTPARLRVVVDPFRAMALNMPAVPTKVFVTDCPVYR
jgi:hypothetical protein